MTGHGEARREGDGFEIHIEVRSVNNRFLRTVTKISEEVAPLQACLEDLVRQKVLRGTVFLTVRFLLTRRTECFQVDEAVLRNYYTRLNALALELNTQERIEIKDLLLLPGAIQTEEHLHPELSRYRDVALQALLDAIDRMNAMRLKEGQFLHDEFTKRSVVLAGHLGKVRTLAATSVGEYQQRLEDRVRQLLANHEISLAPEDIIKEVAILAERSDIAEEIARMESHLRQFGECLTSEEAVGRKLEFLLQEMFREANTMASKSVHAEMNRVLVDMKTELDRLKEQVQNIE
jgi:uncharacterized protein (TIGR00255 family)